MEASLIQKLEHLQQRMEELNGMLSSPEIIQNQQRFRKLSRERADLQDVVSCFNDYQQIGADISGIKTLLDDNEEQELHELFIQELKETETRYSELADELRRLLLPKDPNDNKNIFLEIRAGTGGEEAALFVADLVRMYMRYVEQRRWQVENINHSESERGGYKLFVMRILGAGAYSRLKFESGAHRVQRVPETESQGRIHTSACTVAVLPEADAIADLAINPADLRVDTFRASGAGGQHVNKTDSAIRLTHLPSGVVVECQDERSQHKNKARAMALLQAKLLTDKQDKQRQAEAETRRNLVGSGDRSERIRTYNFPQNRISDHRINLTMYRLDEFMAGDLDIVIEPLINEHKIDQLALLSAQ